MSEFIQHEEADACVVVDQVEMVYRVRSSQDGARKPGVAQGLFNRVRKSSMVSIHALNEISFVAHRGESIGVIGRNGSGKSTLVKLISGQTNPTSGAIYASSLPVMLGVNAALVPALSGTQNIILGGLAMGMRRAEIEQKMPSIIEVSGLEDAVHLPMQSYSSGMASRLRFAIAASIDPEILLVDEALNTGDAQFKNRSKQRMDDLRANAGCVFIVSHSMDTITDMCDRVLWIDKGDLLMDGEPKGITAMYEEFTSQLSKGNGPSALKLRAEVMEQLQLSRIVDRQRRRRKDVSS